MTNVIIDGQPVPQGTAAWFKGLRYAFRERFGLDLFVTSGIRTYEQQYELYKKWLNGTGSYAAKPGSSRHETGRALDIRDSGTDSGVTVAGTVRSNWLRNNSEQYGFYAAGFEFAHIEPWHYELLNPLDPYTVPEREEEEEEDPMLINIQGQAGKRNGGTYYIAGGFATFLGGMTAGLPTLATAQADELAKRVKGI